MKGEKIIIMCFVKEYKFLSNFYRSPMLIDGKYYPTVEHFFQSMKADNILEAREIRQANTPGQAKRLGRSCKMNVKWDEVKIRVMEIGIGAKFDQNSELKKSLLATKNKILEEGNDWNDTFWGKNIKTGEGDNNVGKILMVLRKRYKKEKK